MEKETCIVVSCQSCGNREAIKSQDYEKGLSFYTALSGNIIRYKPVPDSFECPKCRGDMFLDDATVSEEHTAEGTLIKVEAVHVHIDEYEEQQRRLREAKDHEKILEFMIQQLEPLIASNVRYLEHLEGKKLFGEKPFHTEPEDRRNIALVNQITRFTSRATKWNLERASEIAVAVLEDVNMHPEARKVAEVIIQANPNMKHLIAYHFE